MSSLQQAPKEVYNTYLQTASNIVAHVDSERQKEMLEELTDMVKTSCMLDIKLKQSCEILNRLSDAQVDYNADGEELDHQEILEQFKNEIAGINTDVSKHKTFLDFQQQVQVFLSDATQMAPADSDNEELVMTQKAINVIDPITKKRMIDPVRNTACGHVYDRESVTALLKGNKHTRCPVVGCGNKNYILLDNLQTDFITKRFLDTNVA